MKEKYIEERKNRNGELTSYRVNAKFPDGKVYRKTFSLKDYKSPKECLKAAVKDRNSAMYEYEHGTFVDAKQQKITVDELFKMIPECTSKRQGTYRKYNVIYHKWIEPLYGKKKILDITRADIESTLKKAAETCVRQHVSNILTIWKMIFDIAIYDLDISIKNRAMKIDFPECNHRTKRSKEERNISEKDFQSFCSFMEEYGHYMPYEKAKIYNRNIMLLCMRLNRYLGLRPQEIRALSRDNIEFLELSYYDASIGKKSSEPGVKIHVENSVGSTLTQQLALTGLKTAGSERYVYGGSEVRKLVKEIMVYSKHDILFSDYEGNLISSTQMASYIHRVCKQWNEKNGTDIDVYAVLMRKAMSSDNYRNNVNPITIKNMMGHTEVTTSANWYASSAEQDKIDAALNREFKQ